MRLAALLAALCAVNVHASGEWSGTLCRKAAGAVSTREVCTTTTAPHIALREGSGVVVFRWMRRDGKLLIVGSTQTPDIQLDAPYAALRLKIDVDRATLTREPANLTLQGASSVAWTTEIRPSMLPMLEEIRVPKGDYRMVLAMRGWQTVYRDGLHARAEEPLQLGRLAMTRLPLVTGRVIDATTNEPLPNATIGSSDGQRLATTGPDGTFTIDTLGDLPLYLTVDAADHARAVVPVRRGGAARVEIGDIVLGAGGSVRVHVVRHCSTACRTDVELLRRQDLDPRPNRWDKLGTASPDAEGNVTFDRVANGAYVLLVKGSGPLEQRTESVEVKAGRAASISLDLEPTPLHGSVTRGGKPLPHATLRFTGRDRVHAAEIETDDQGDYSAERWQNGPVTVTVQPAGETERYTEERLLTSADAEWSLAVPAAQIAGRVFDNDSRQPVAGVRVFDEVSAVGFHSSGHAVVTDGDGRFAFTLARAGRHVLHVESPEHLDAASVTLQIVNDHSVTDVDFPLTRGSSAFIRITDHAGRAVPQAFIVDRLPPDGYPDRAGIGTDAFGMAVLPLGDRESRRIWIVSADGAFATATLDATEKTSRDAPRVIALETPVATLRFHIMKKGKPAAGANLLIQRDGLVIPPGVLEMIAFQQRGSDTTDMRGDAVLPLMPGGSYIAAAYRGNEQYLEIRAHRLQPRIRRFTVAGGVVDVELEEPEVP